MKRIAKFKQLKVGRVYNIRKRYILDYNENEIYWILDTQRTYQYTGLYIGPFHEYLRFIVIHCRAFDTPDSRRIMDSDLTSDLCDEKQYLYSPHLDDIFFKKHFYKISLLEIPIFCSFGCDGLLGCRGIAIDIVSSHSAISKIFMKILKDSGESFNKTGNNVNSYLNLLNFIYMQDKAMKKTLGSLYEKSLRL